MFFSIWTNQYPYQLSNYLIPLDQSFGWSTQSSVDPWAVLYRNMLEGAGRLYDALSANAEVSEKDYFVRTEELPAMKERYTSIDPYPNPKEVVFKKDITKIDELNQKFYDLNYPSVAFIQAGAFIHAVDDNPDTCWNSYHAPKVGDHFGLQFVTPTAVKSIVLHSLKVSLKDMSSKISVHVSDRAGSEWTLCRHSLKSTSDHKVQLDVNCRPTGSTSSNGLFHQVKVQFDAELEKAIEVCGIEVGDMVL
ncbi:hypothetical protein BGW38_008478 [Lunasporangiospora selenospora]|uniref:Uncharacterized protein n=1 Tax=Lunasporangiospora selenospora TaxID=979761 RepID=A0A9P6FL63_9FUNG|nr:hypothetical protein BGW38_008478 [Lunasporangiospora selenospora]